MFGARQLSLNRDTEPVVALTPNIGLISYALKSSLLLLLWPRTVWINSALDLRQPLLVLMNHRGDRNCATYDDRHDRHQQST
jgi:hypothetical protein